MLCRWALALQEFDFKIAYRPSNCNSNADALSCVSSPCCATSIETSPTFWGETKIGQQQDPVLSQLYRMAGNFCEQKVYNLSQNCKFVEFIFANEHTVYYYYDV